MHHTAVVAAAAAAATWQWKAVAADAVGGDSTVAVVVVPADDYDKEKMTKNGAIAETIQLSKWNHDK